MPPASIEHTMRLRAFVVQRGQYIYCDSARRR
jgi:hypothetical protein